MTRSVFSAGILAAALLTGGCATKKYVQQTTTPIQAKVDQVSAHADQNTKDIQANKAELSANITQVDEKAQSGISGAKEAAMTAQNHANDAMNKANQANDLGTKNTEEIAHLRQFVGNLDDYKQVADLTIPFAFNKYRLTDKDQQDLDNLAGTASKNKHFFIAVEGFTDRVGTVQYNEALSRKRADAVTQYLVAKHDIPIYRIHMIGLGEQKPLDDGHNRAARAKNRRVEVKVFSADESYAMSSSLQNQPAGQPAAQQPQQQPQAQPQQ